MTKTKTPKEEKVKKPKESSDIIKDEAYFEKQEEEKSKK